VARLAQEHDEAKGADATAIASQTPLAQLMGIGFGSSAKCGARNNDFCRITQKE
jgi:hypothetical protein